MIAALPALASLKPNPHWARLPIFVRKGWKTVRFGEVVRMLKEQTDPVPDGVERYVAGEHMETENVHIRQWGNVGEGYLGPAFIRRFRKGQVLYGSRRTYLKKVAVAEWDGVTANTTFVLEAVEGQLLQELLPWLMLSERFTKHSIQESKGSTNPYINFPDIAKFEFALPPLYQQRRIAEILWAVDETEQETKKVSVSLDQCIGAELSAVFSNPNGDAPLLRIEDVAAKQKNAIVDGPFGSKLKSIHYRTSGVPVIQSNFVTSGRFNAQNYVYVTPQHFESEKRSKAEPGDIIMAKIGENCGTCAILPEDHLVSIVAGNVLKITTDPTICLNTFLLYFFKYEYARNRLINVKNTTAQPAISLAQLKRLQFCVPPIKKQEEMLMRVSHLENARSETINQIQATSVLRTTLINQIIV